MPPLAALCLKNHFDSAEFVDMAQVATLWPSITLKGDKPNSTFHANGALSYTSTNGSWTNKLSILKASAWCGE